MEHRHELRNSCCISSAISFDKSARIQWSHFTHFAHIARRRAAGPSTSDAAPAARASGRRSAGASRRSAAGSSSRSRSPKRSAGGGSASLPAGDDAGARADPPQRHRAALGRPARGPPPECATSLDGGGPLDDCRSVASHARARPNGHAGERERHAAAPGAFVPAAAHERRRERRRPGRRFRRGRCPRNLAPSATPRARGSPASA
jgi:hypothetical protein